MSVPVKIVENLNNDLKAKYEMGERFLWYHSD